MNGNGDITLDQSILPLSEYIEKYPLAFLSFGETYPDPTKWDKLFHVSRKGHLNHEIKVFFATNDLWLVIHHGAIIGKEPDKVSIIKVATKISVKYKNKVEVFSENGEYFTVLAKAVEFLFSSLDHILECKETGIPNKFESDS